MHAQSAWPMIRSSTAGWSTRHALDPGHELQVFEHAELAERDARQIPDLAFHRHRLLDTSRLAHLADARRRGM